MDLPTYIKLFKLVSFQNRKTGEPLIIMNDRIGAAYYTQKTHGELSISAEAVADDSELP
jgi:hypothetical protein